MSAARRALVAIGGALVLVATGVVRAAPPDPAAEFAARAAKARAVAAEDLRKLASWGDRNGLERTADEDWERARALDPDHEETLRRLRFVRRGTTWVRDEPSAVLARLAPDAKPDRAPEYRSRRLAEVARPALRRTHALAAFAFGAGLRKEGEAVLEDALLLDPDDPWARLGLGHVPDPYEGWVPAAVAARRIADAGAAAEIRRLGALRSEAIRQEGSGPASFALGTPTSTWRLREWTLETDLPDDAAAHALATVDLGARWFRAAFGIPVSARVLPFDGSFLVLSTNELYLKAIDAEPRLSAGEKRFGRALGGMPVDHRRGRDPWHVILERPSDVSAADGCLHFAIHFLLEAQFGITSRDAWLYEGLAAYAVFRIQQTNDTWCVELEQTSTRVAATQNPDPSSWADLALVDVARKDDYPLRGLFGASVNNLDAGMLVKSWSVLRWMIEEHPADALAFLAAKKAGRSSDVALEEATGLRPEDVDALWRRHVLATGGE